MRIAVLLTLVLIFSCAAAQDLAALNAKLFEAVADMNLTQAAEAIDAGADVNAVDDDGWPLFITAINGKQTGIIRLFLNAGVKLDITGPDGKTPLMHALASKNAVLAELLVQKGASIHIKDPKGKTPLMFAAEAGNANLVKLLLAKGADRKAASEDGRTALEYALDARQKATIDLLGVMETLPVDFQNAIENGNAELLKKTLSRGADIEWKNSEGKPAIVVAIEKGHLPILLVLIEAKADLNKKYFKQNTTLFMYAMHLGQYGAAELLLKNGAIGDLDLRYKEGRTALMLAILDDRPNLINLILTKDFKPNIADSYGRTALMYAAEKNMADVVKKLLDKGSDPCIRQFEGKDAAKIAKEKGFARIEQMLKAKDSCQ